MQTIERERMQEAQRPGEPALGSPPVPAAQATAREDPAPARPAPGVELHPKVYASLLLATVAFVLASWLAFGKDGETDYLLLIVAFVFGAFSALPMLIFRAGRKATREDGAGSERPSFDEFLASRVETGSGALTGRQAWVQIAVIPICLALAAILIGLAAAAT